MPRVIANAGGSGVTVTTTAETVIATVAGVTTTGPGETVDVHISGTFTTGAATTAVTFTCRRGTTVAGTAVGTAQAPNAAASTTIPYSFDFLDTPGELANQSYVVTATQTAATGNGNAVNSVVSATVGTPF